MNMGGVSAGMDKVESINTAGLSSLSGFSYQIKVFIFRLTQMQKGQQVEFETLDDVTVKSIFTKDSNEDSCFKLSVDEFSSIEVFQVKQTNVATKVERQILYNWLLAYNARPEISKFTLYIDSGYSFSRNVFSNTPEDEFKAIIKATNKSSAALVSKVKQIYQNDFTHFQNDFQMICNKFEVKILDNIEKLIEEGLEQPFHSTGIDIGNTYFEKRIEELFTRVCARIMDCANRRIPYICTFAEYMQLCEEICGNISPMQYTPDYESFRQIYSQSDLTEEIKLSREYRQLTYCALPSADVLEHLRWEQYYKNIRDHYLADAKKAAISKTEGIAHQNYKDVVCELKADDADLPIRRLIRTKNRSISTLDDEYSRWGTYIFLTQDNMPNQISWKDEDDDINE